MLHRFPSEAMSRRELALAIGGLLVCLFLAAIDTSIVNTALPRVAAELHGFDVYPWVTTGYLLSTTSVVPLVGKLGDRYGRRTLLIGGVAYFLVVTALCGFAQDMSQLIGLRTLQGIGGGIVTATVFASMGELLSPVARARVSGLITATFSSASILGPLVGGFLTDTFTWRAVFYANVPFGLVALLALWRVFPTLRPAHGDRRPPMDVGGAVTLTGASVLFLLALGWGGHEFDWLSPILLTTLAVALALAVAFIRIERRAVDPVMPLSLFGNNVVALTALGALLQAMATFGGALFIPLFAQGVLGASATLSGGLLAPMVAATLSTNAVVGLAIAHFGRYRVFLLIGFAISSVGFWLLATAGPGTPYSFLIVTMLVIGLGAGFLVGTLSLASQNAASLSEMGVVTSFAQFSRSMGNTLGSAVLGSIMLIQLGSQVKLDGSEPLSDMREPLAAALRWVFLAAGLLMAGGFVASAFLRDLPMQRRRVLQADPEQHSAAVAQAAVSPTRAEPYRPPAPTSGVPRPR